MFGYWDLHGYDGLFTAHGWDAVRLTSNVRGEIQTLASLMHTSPAGRTFLSEVPGALTAFAGLNGYRFSAWTEAAGPSNWDEFTREIDRGDPVLLAVDSNGDGTVDHSVSAVGYQEKWGEHWYAMYTTWDESETVKWGMWEHLTQYQMWWVGFMTFVHPDLVPEPSSLLLLGSGLAALGGIVWKRHRRG